jgi:hypothetical protein
MFDFYDGKAHTVFVGNWHDLVAFAREDDILVGFNNHSYDDLLLRTVLADPDVTPAELNAVSKRIVESRPAPRDIYKLQYSPTPWAFSIDMFQILNKKASLKEFEAREMMPSVREGLVDFTAPLADDMVEQTIAYCQKDVEATWILYQKHIEKIKLRKRLKALFTLDNRVYCLGDAGIAQYIFLDAYHKRTGNYNATARRDAATSNDNMVREWDMPHIVSKRVAFTTPEFQAFFHQFMHTHLQGDVDGTTWKFNRFGGPESGPGIDPFEKPIQLGSLTYKIGVGGIHSVDKPGRFEANDEIGIFDIDAQSFYPSLIIVEELFPSQLGPEFLSDYRRVRDMRVSGKIRVKEIKAGIKKLKANTMNESEIRAKISALEKELVDETSKMDGLKVPLNGTFGLTNNKYSPLRSIPTALRVTINGQLMALMLVEMLEDAGVRVISANTDGVTILWHKAEMDVISGIMRQWGEKTGHTLELEEYAKYCRRDVNSYTAVKTSGDIKRKGAFNPEPDNGKTDERIVKRAAEKYLLEGTPIHETIQATADVRDFVYYQRVKNGGELFHGEAAYGRTLRWYVGKEGLQVARKNPDGSFENIPNGANAVLALELPTTMPVDVNHEYYMREAKKLVESITKRPKAKRVKAHA